MFRICLYDVCFACIESSYKSSSCCLSVLPTYIQFVRFYICCWVNKERKKRKKENDAFYRIIAQSVRLERWSSQSAPFPVILSRNHYWIATRKFFTWRVHYTLQRPRPRDNDNCRMRRLHTVVRYLKDSHVNNVNALNARKTRRTTSKELGDLWLIRNGGVISILIIFIQIVFTISSLVSWQRNLISQSCIPNAVITRPQTCQLQPSTHRGFNDPYTGWAQFTASEKHKKNQQKTGSSKEQTSSIKNANARIINTKKNRTRCRELTQCYRLAQVGV